MYFGPRFYAFWATFNLDSLSRLLHSSNLIYNYTPRALSVHLSAINNSPKTLKVVSRYNSFCRYSRPTTRSVSSTLFQTLVIRAQPYDPQWVNISPIYSDIINFAYLFVINVRYLARTIHELAYREPRNFGIENRVRCTRSKLVDGHCVFYCAEFLFSACVPSVFVIANCAHG